MAEQVEWFANAVGNIIGTIAGKADDGWSYAVLKGDRKGNYRVCTLGGDTFSFRAARSRFLLDMEAAEKAEEEIARLERRQAMTNRQTMKQKTERVKPLSEREVQAFLNDDRELSEQGSIQWRRDGIWRWVSSDGLAFAASDGRTVEISRTANAEPVTVSLQR